MKGLGFPVGIAINVGIGTGNYLTGRVTWAGCPLAQYVHNQEIHLCSLVCLLSEQCTALLPHNGNPRKPDFDDFPSQS